MPIETICSCGRALTLRDELAGKLVRCPACAGTLNVPLPADEVVEDIVAGPPRLPPPLPPGLRKVDEIAVAPPAPPPPRKEKAKKKKKKSVYQEYYGAEGKPDPTFVLDEGWFASMNSGIIGGAITLMVGIVLLVIFILIGGWWRTLWISGLLIVVGILGILKGLIDLSD